MSQVDVVTEAQQQLSVLCSHFYATIGSLQRDAPPLTVKGEPLLGAAEALQTPIREQTHTMAQQVIQSSKQLERLILQLPDRLESEEQQFAALRDLQQQHTEAGITLNTTLKQAHNCLTLIQDRFAELADKHLQCCAGQ